MPNEDDATEPPPEDPKGPMPILQLRALQAEQVDRHQRLVERLTYAVGKPRSLYVTVVAVLGWIAWNSLSPRFGVVALDPPPFSGLQVTVSVLALLMTTIVLTTQSRQGRHADQRSHLDLQVNLLAEQKIAKLIALVEELRRDMPTVHDRRDATAEAMTQALDPVAIISALERDDDEPRESSAEAAGAPPATENERQPR
jgi:uncharacterized membrane protein